MEQNFLPTFGAGGNQLYLRKHVIKYEVALGELKIKILKNKK
jgi:hypothetical protein